MKSRKKNEKHDSPKAKDKKNIHQELAKHNQMHQDYFKSSHEMKRKPRK